ncbi:hypothetical protein LTR85_000725 [Meristemomyces frigidus]|nr:hypothetical protein LTR85_000725 [Meristemomyces frigidus]
MASSTPANFLGLPTELGLHIYEHVIRLSIEYDVLRGYNKERFAPYGHYGHTLRNDKASLQLPWLDLQRTCWIIHDELRGFMHTPNGLRLGGDGGPTAIVPALFHSLKHFLHCGPTLNTQRLLYKPMHIEELVIIYEHGEEATPDEMAAWALRDVAPLNGRRQPRLSQHQQSYQNLCWEVGKALSPGILFGYVDKVVLKSAWDQHERVVEEGPGVPDYWPMAGYKSDGLRPKDFTDYFEELPIHLLDIEASAAV